MNIELLERTENPIEAESKVQKIASEIIYLVKRMDIQQNIKQTLDIDDRLIASRINKELENTITDINKTDRERFIETVKVKDIPKLPTDILDDKEENQNIKENHKMYLDVNVIE